MIKKLSESHDVTFLCRVLRLPRSSYYAALKRPPSNRELYNRELKVRLLDLYNASGGRYGSGKLHRLLVREGYTVGQFKVLKLMRELNIRSVVVKKYRHSKHTSDNQRRENLEPVFKNDLKAW